MPENQPEIELHELKPGTDREALLRTCKSHIKERVLAKGQEYELPAEKITEALQKVDEFRLFLNSRELLTHIYQQDSLSLSKKSRDTFRIAMLMLNTAAIASSVVDQDKNTPFVVMLPLSSFADKSKLIGHELEHIADALLNLINKEDRKTAKRMRQINLMYNVLNLLSVSFLVPTVHQTFDRLTTASSEATKIAEAGIFALSLIGALTSEYVYRKLPHEQRANQAGALVGEKKFQKEQNSFTQKLRRLFKGTQ